jgi:hypothetical protein
MIAMKAMMMKSEKRMAQAHDEGPYYVRLSLCGTSMIEMKTE